MSFLLFKVVVGISLVFSAVLFGAMLYDYIQDEKNRD